MIGFKSIASSSKGNAYIVKADTGAPLLIEAGVPIRKIQEALAFRLTDIAGCLVSHEHMDHAKAVKDLLKAGVDCYMSLGTMGALGFMHHRLIPLNNPRSFDGMLIDGWRIKTFPLEHDATEPLGFLIAHGDDRLLFIPDTAYVRQRFEGVTLAAVECNHIGDVLGENIQDGNVPAVVGRRVRRNHMSLETLIQMLKANDLSRCRAIYLLHLSDTNSDERRMKDEVQRATGIPVVVC